MTYKISSDFSQRLLRKWASEDLVKAGFLLPSVYALAGAASSDRNRGRAAGRGFVRGMGTELGIGLGAIPGYLTLLRAYQNRDKNLGMLGLGIGALGALGGGVTSHYLGRKGVGPVDNEAHEDWMREEIDRKPTLKTSAVKRALFGYAMPAGYGAYGALSSKKNRGKSGLRGVLRGSITGLGAGLGALPGGVAMMINAARDHDISTLEYPAHKPASIAGPLALLASGAVGGGLIGHYLGGKAVGPVNNEKHDAWMKNLLRKADRAQSLKRLDQNRYFDKDEDVKAYNDI